MFCLYLDWHRTVHSLWVGIVSETDPMRNLCLGECVSDSDLCYKCLCLVSKSEINGRVWDLGDKLMCTEQEL